MKLKQFISNFSEPNTLQIHIGAHNFTAPDDEVLVIYDVESITFHEDYNPNTYENDIALLLLTEEITFSENVQPVCQPDPSVDYTDEDCVVSGWGSLNYAIDPGILIKLHLCEYTCIVFFPAENFYYF